MCVFMAEQFLCKYKFIVSNNLMKIENNKENILIRNINSEPSINE